MGCVIDMALDDLRRVDMGARYGRETPFFRKGFSILLCIGRKIFGRARNLKKIVDNLKSCYCTNCMVAVS